MRSSVRFDYMNERKKKNNKHYLPHLANAEII